MALYLSFTLFYSGITLFYLDTLKFYLKFYPYVTQIDHAAAFRTHNT